MEIYVFVYELIYETEMRKSMYIGLISYLRISFKQINKL